MRLAAAIGMVAAPVEARITRIEITDVLGPFPDGYQQIIGTARGEVLPEDLRNAVIQDMGLAPRNERGTVEYSMKFTVLRPPLDKSNGLLFYEPVNVGFPFTQLEGLMLPIGQLARERGYTLVFSGWEATLVPFPPFVPISVLQHILEAPVATLHGEEITGRIQTEFAVSFPTSTTPLIGPRAVPMRSYVTADTADPDAVLSRRVRQSDPPVAVPRGDWAFADCQTTPFPGVPDPSQICLSTGFDPNFVYQLTYTARSPIVQGIGFAATRDLVSFLRHEAVDDAGIANPVAGTMRAAVLHGTSESSAFARQFLHLGFNEDEAGRIVFEGMNPHAAPDRLPLNVRFQISGPALQHTEHLRPFTSPFAFMPYFDSVAGRVGWLFERCRRSDTCPKVIQTVTSTEYWQLRASVVTTDPLGLQDVPVPPNVRTYLFSSSQHVPATEPAAGFCQQLNNPNDYRPVLRALIVALERWVLEGRRPPRSRIPNLREGTLVTSVQETVGWPDIPGVRYTGLVNTLPLVDYGARFEPEDESGILTEPRTLVPGREYAVLVPRVDEDGNEVAGIRTSAIRAPLGTYTGWNLRRAGFGEDELCDLEGSFVPFAETEIGRLGAGDPRLSLEERYGDHQGYVAAVRHAVEELISEGLLLEEDALPLLAEAEASDVLKD